MNDKVAETGAVPRFRPLAPKAPRRIGPYPLIGRVGAGGMGVVYAGRRVGEPVAAVKVIHPELVAESDFRARFAREVALLARVSSPRVPRLLQADTAADPPWLATEFVPGSDLGAMVRRRGPLPDPLLDGLAAGVAEALRAVHSAGIVHRDLKPSNVMLSPGGPKVLDFGIARAVNETALTRTGGLVGTPGWMAPELFSGEGPSPAADVFAWGALVAYAATGREPFGGGAPDVLVHRVVHGEPDLDGVPDRLLPAVRSALAKDPRERPPAERIVAGLTGATGSGEKSAHRVEDLLKRTWAGVTARVPEPAQAGRGRRRWPWVAAGAVGLAGAVSAGLVASLLTSPGPGAGAPSGEAVPAAGDAGEETGEAPWSPPEAVTEGANMEFETSVGLDPEGFPGFSKVSTTYRSFWTATVTGITYQEGEERVAITFVTAAMPSTYGEFVPEAFTLLSPEGVFEPIGHEPSVFDSVDAEVTLFFSGAPPRGLLVFGDAEYEPNVAGAQPVGVCYDAPEAAFSDDFDTCLAEIAEGPDDSGAAD